MRDWVWTFYSLIISKSYIIGPHLFNSFVWFPISRILNFNTCQPHLLDFRSGDGGRGNSLVSKITTEQQQQWDMFLLYPFCSVAHHRRNIIFVVNVLKPIHVSYHHTSLLTLSVIIIIIDSSPLFILNAYHRHFLCMIWQNAHIAEEQEVCISKFRTVTNFKNRF